MISFDLLWIFPMELTRKRGDGQLVIHGPKQLIETFFKKQIIENIKNKHTFFLFFFEKR